MIWLALPLTLVLVRSSSSRPLRVETVMLSGALPVAGADDVVGEAGWYHVGGLGDGEVALHPSERAGREQRPVADNRGRGAGRNALELDVVHDLACACGLGHGEVGSAGWFADLEVVRALDRGPAFRAVGVLGNLEHESRLPVDDDVDADPVDVGEDLAPRRRVALPARSSAKPGRG